MTNVTIETVAPINPYALDESEIEEIIDDLKDRGVEPTYTFEKWSQHPFGLNPLDETPS